jgi:hypothetical protein
MTIEDLSGTHRKSAEVVALIDGIEDRANYWIQVDPTVEQFMGLTDNYSKKIIFYERSMLL